MLVNLEFKAILSSNEKLIPTRFSGEQGTIPIHGKFLGIHAIVGSQILEVVGQNEIDPFGMHILSFVHAFRIVIPTLQPMLRLAEVRRSSKCGK